jgi:UDP-N-acetyl-D-glucosamine dehydrogenase
MLTRDILLDRIRDRNARVGVIGLGYVGLPLAVEFADAGFSVVGYDVSDRVVSIVNDGRSHIADVAASEVAALVKAKRLLATTDAMQLEDLDAISIAVPTPLAKTRDPDMSYVLSAVETVSRVARAGQLIVLESTTYPGTTRELLLPAMEARGLVVGHDVFLAFSPERVDPGNERWSTRNTPKVVGGMTPACTEVAAALYGACIESVVPVSSPEAAELTKLLENTFRSVNIALVNEMAIVCDKLGVDVWEVIDAAATKPFGFMRFTPGPGIGGHCIPLDPHYLAWKMRTLNYKTRFIDLASEINSEMPTYVVEKIVAALNVERKAANGSRILVIGVTYKRDVDDTRESPALDIIRLLEGLGADVAYHDPYVRSFQEDGIRHESVSLSDAELERSDAVVIVTDHSKVDYQLIVNRASLVVDTRNATARTTRGRARVVSLSAVRTQDDMESAPVVTGRGTA